MCAKVLVNRMEEVAEEAFPKPLFIYAPLATAPRFQMGMGTHGGLLPVGLTPTAVVLRTYDAQLLFDRMGLRVDARNDTWDATPFQRYRGIFM